jgi:hypothetical protein
MEGKDEERTERGGKSGLDVAHKRYADIFADTWRTNVLQVSHKVHYNVNTRKANDPSSPCFMWLSAYLYLFRQLLRSCFSSHLFSR